MGQFLNKKTIFIFLFVGASLFLAAAYTLFVWFDPFPNPSDYRPRFKRSRFELLLDNQFRAKLYYKTNEKHSVGDEVKDLTFVVPFQKSAPDTPQVANEGVAAYDITYLNNAVDFVGPDFVVFAFNHQNFDCFAIYQDNRLIKYEVIEEFSLLPTPSDTWMCKGFDFKNFIPARDVKTTDGNL